MHMKINSHCKTKIYFFNLGRKNEGEQMKFQESESVELKSIVQDDKMIKETDGDSFEEMRSINQALSFDALKQEFERCH